MIDTRELDRPNRDMSNRRRSELIITGGVQEYDEAGDAPRRHVAETLIARYVDRAMLRSRTKRYAEDGTWFAEISGVPDVWAEGQTEDEALATLASVLRDWLELKIDDQDRDIPPLDGVNLNAL